MSGAGSGAGLIVNADSVEKNIPSVYFVKRNRKMLLPSFCKLKVMQLPRQLVILMLWPFASLSLFSRAFLIPFFFCLSKILGPFWSRWIKSFACFEILRFFPLIPRSP